MVFLTDAQVHYAIATIIGIALVKMGWRWEMGCIFFMLEHKGYKVLQNEIMTIKENLVDIRDQLVAREQSWVAVSSPKIKVAHRLMILPMLRCIIASTLSTLQTSYWLASACSRWCGADWRGLGGAGASSGGLSWQLGGGTGCSGASWRRGKRLTLAASAMLSMLLASRFT